MLCVKPCIVRFSGGGHHVEDEIEFSNIHKADDMQQPMMGQYAAVAGDDSYKNVDQMMNERQLEMQKLDLQLKKMGKAEGGHSFGDVVVHQMIETIEFALGTVSNTASYLRLWALSLAHGQLAEVFMDLLMAKYGGVYTANSKTSTIILGIIIWPIFWGVTQGILMFMDALECFLHTIRLHWVEFQNKFYEGEGYQFKPYSYIAILTQTLHE